MMEKKQPLQQILLGKVVICLQKTEIDPCLSPFTSIVPKWIKDLNIRSKTLKLAQIMYTYVNTCKNDKINVFLSRGWGCPWNSSSGKSVCLASIIP
jgi:hypothetical protein